MGIPKDKIVVWPKNGIEHYYPPAILDEIYGAGTDIVVEDDVVSRNGISYKKAELQEKVIARLEKATPMHPEFENLFLTVVEKTLGLAAS